MTHTRPVKTTVPWSTAGGPAVPRAAESLSHGGTHWSNLLQSTRLYTRPHRSTVNEELGAAALSQELHLQLQARGAWCKSHCRQPLGSYRFIRAANQIIRRCGSGTSKPTRWPLHILCITPENSEKSIGLSSAPRAETLYLAMPQVLPLLLRSTL